MPVTSNDVIKVALSHNELNETIEVATNIVTSIIDRGDLHQRDLIERFCDCLMGEIAERMVIKWLKEQKKFCESAVNKQSNTADLGHDIWLFDTNNKRIRASVKSSLSALKNKPQDILNTFTLATTPKEVREVNIQVYFWLVLYDTPRISVLSSENAAIFAWASGKDLGLGDFQKYAGERRLAPNAKLAALRPMLSLIHHLR